MSENKIKLKDAGYRELVFAKSLIVEHIYRWVGKGPGFSKFIEEAFRRAKEEWFFDPHKDELCIDDGSVVRLTREGSASRDILISHGLDHNNCEPLTS